MVGTDPAETGRRRRHRELFVAEHKNADERADGTLLGATQSLPPVCGVLRGNLYVKASVGVHWWILRQVRRVSVGSNYGIGEFADRIDEFPES